VATKDGGLVDHTILEVVDQQYVFDIAGKYWQVSPTVEYGTGVAERDQQITVRLGGYALGLTYTGERIHVSHMYVNPQY
jgi:hypothetical protein